MTHGAPPSVSGTAGFRVNPGLDVAAFSAQLADRGRVQVTPFLAPGGAEALERAMAEQVPWSFTYFDGEACVIEAANLDRIGSQELIAVQKKVYARAGHGFSYAYGMYHADGATRQITAQSPLLHRFFDFLAGPEMLGLIRAIVRDDDVLEVDAQATRFGPGNFLSYHNDLMPKANRRCAYVVNLTRAWRPDWGGQLQFFDARGNGTDAFMPSFNTLNLFTVPQPHAVAYIAPFAGAFRYAVSGWYRGTPMAGTGLPG